MSWEFKSLDELGFIGRGKSRHRPRNDERLYNGIYPLIQTSEIQASNLYINSFHKTYNDFGLAQSKLWKEGTLCLSIVGANTAETAILGFDACFPDSVIGFNAFENISDNLFVKYLFDFIKVELKSISEGTARENLSLEKLLSRKREVPNYQTQKRIANILSNYDDLIENNLKRIKLLEETAQNIYKEWFVDFRFPNYEHTAFDEESGLPVGLRKSKLKNHFPILTGKKDANHSSQNGQFPFFTCGKEFLLSNDFAFDCDAILLAGNGEFNVKYYRGKFQAYQRTYVLCPENKNELFLIYIVLKLNLKHLISGSKGSVIKFLTKGMIEDFSFILPNTELLNLFHFKINLIYLQVENLNNQNQKLKEARDILLPRLMNRTIEV